MGSSYTFGNFYPYSYKDHGHYVHFGNAFNDQVHNYEDDDFLDHDDFLDYDDFLADYVFHDDVLHHDEHEKEELRFVWFTQALIAY
jgi:hypothetical protein